MTLEALEQLISCYGLQYILHVLQHLLALTNKNPFLSIEMVFAGQTEYWVNIDTSRLFVLLIAFVCLSRIIN